MMEAVADSLPETFLIRLKRLVSIRNERYAELNAEGLAMVDRSIFSIFRDCEREGLSKEARDILGSARSEDQVPAAPLVLG
ncbi:MAG: hypothetical protein GEU28_01790 [Dehalococcoidia bacterium]|nr:hypothetical protein [Dehalococcoidia bacterium]